MQFALPAVKNKTGAETTKLFPTTQITTTLPPAATIDCSLSSTSKDTAFATFNNDVKIEKTMTTATLYETTTTPTATSSSLSWECNTVNNATDYTIGEVVAPFEMEENVELGELDGFLLDAFSNVPESCKADGQPAYYPDLELLLP